MPVSALELFEQTLPNHIYPQLSLALANLREFIPGVAKLLSEADLLNGMPEVKRFTVLTSKSFSALVYQTSTQAAAETKLTFEAKAIAIFLTDLRQQCCQQPQLQRLIDQALERQAHKTNDAKLQSQFTLQILAALTPTLGQASLPLTYPQQQVTQDRLLQKLITQIHESLDLPVILTTAVAAVREFLQVDRLVIYQLSPGSDEGEQVSSSGQAATATPIPKGSITHEALAGSEVASVLHYQEPFCGVSSQDFFHKYQHGLTLAIADIEPHYHQAQCLRDFLHSIQVRALLITPILVKSQLWGLLIAHQCNYPRQWQPQEQDLLKQVGEHLAIAIYQAQLCDQIQRQTQTLEDQVQQRTQELHAALIATQSAPQAKSDFLATMSHELRTPLTCVIGMSATLLRWSLGPLTEKQRSCLQTIQDSGEHLLELINDILDFSHVQSGKATLNLSEFSLSALMQQIMQVMRDKADAHEVQLKANLKIPPERDRFIADLRRVQQILISLLDNAIKFTPMGGKITLRVWVETNTVVFQVEDTGIGIAPSQQPYLFEKFQQLDTSYRRTYEGAGLGLALAQQCVTLHQGWIDVSSVEGQGSIFTVQLPNQSTLPTNATTLGSTSLSGGRIVLIEGNEEEATLLCDILTAANYQVVWMVEASAAIDQIRLLQPLAIIVDAQLPAQGCMSLIRRLRELPKTDNLKIIVLTPAEISKDHQRYLSLGADTYLPKSIQPEDFLRKVEILLSSASIV
ncbi:MAG: GAF domain-containing protein [Acaryochloris sp. RU_4_1]|nr:GAF domain-containing protein [Acaryochloris sp. RU_4_1]NJR54215.1 GAF domain-containing protein [Acaryochloris sp. CRU_2_0]